MLALFEYQISLINQKRKKKKKRFVSDEKKSVLKIKYKSQILSFNLCFYLHLFFCTLCSFSTCKSKSKSKRKNKKELELAKALFVVCSERRERREKADGKKRELAAANIKFAFCHLGAFFVIVVVAQHFVH